MAIAVCVTSMTNEGVFTSGDALMCCVFVIRQLARKAGCLYRHNPDFQHLVTEWRTYTHTLGEL